jgi:hypothetical protein
MLRSALIQIKDSTAPILMADVCFGSITDRPRSTTFASAMTKCPLVMVRAGRKFVFQLRLARLTKE